MIEKKIRILSNNKLYIPSIKMEISDTDIKLIIKKYVKENKLAILKPYHNKIKWLEAEITLQNSRIKKFKEENLKLVRTYAQKIGIVK